jgi:flagellin
LLLAKNRASTKLDRKTNRYPVQRAFAHTTQSLENIMASVLNTNMASVSAQRFLSSAQNKLGVSYERLSSGLRINRAQDDAAGMGISQALTASIGATNMATRNANDAIGVLQTAEGALTEISSMLQRFKELATQGNNAALSEDQLAYISVEMGNLAEEIGAISTRTTFNTIGLLDGGTNADNGLLVFQTGEATSQTITIGTSDINGGTGFASLGELIQYDFTNPDGAGLVTEPTEYATLAETIDQAIIEVATQRAKYGAQVNRLNHNVANLDALYENLTAANSRILDTDYANETAQLTKTQILQQAATAMLSQANAQPNVVLALLK